ncbi:hypothetical protein THRCLA_01761 [Thraustotheca clavata]|uniref:LicD/FKTN/FKRP nucleotidyltransferase domain-containing protein n=1 Tax=Thraustotheca clavata TaxID=74557 RepID=A0A1W0A857_9STRA|nr:hypothetical protein THRCLA_01761 [Thraustotheca clavata]
MAKARVLPSKLSIFMAIVFFTLVLFQFTYDPDITHWKTSLRSEEPWTDEKGGIHLTDPLGQKECVVLWTGHLQVEFMNTSHCYSLEERQTYLRSMVYTFTELMDANGIEYWVDSGTLLGVIRSEGLIPFDTDADIGLTQAALEKLRHLNLIIPTEYELFVNDSPFYKDGPYSYLPARFVHKITGLYIDMFEFIPSKKVLRIKTHDVVELEIEPHKQALYKNNITSVRIHTLKNTTVKMEIDTVEDVETDMFGPVPSLCWWECQQCVDREFIVPKDWIFPLQRCKFDEKQVWCPAKWKEYLTILYGDDFMTPRETH